MTTNNIENQEQYKPTESQKKLVISNAPSKAWIFILIILGLAAICLQSPGLHSLVTFNSQKEQWIAAEAQRESLREEWEKMLNVLESKVNDRQKQLVQVEARLATMQKDYEEENGKLTKIKELHALTMQSRDSAESERFKAQNETQSFLLEKTKIQSQLSSLSEDKKLLEENISILTEQAKSAEQIYNDKNIELTRIKTALKTTQDQLNEIHADQQTAQDNLRTAQVTWLNIFEEQKEALQNKSDALAETSKAVAALKELQSEMEKIGELTGKHDALKTQIDTLNVSLASFETQQYELIQQITQAELILQNEKQVLSVVLGSKGELDTKISAEKDALSDLSRRNAKLSGEIEALTKQRDSLVKEIQKMKTTNNEPASNQSTSTDKTSETVSASDTNKGANN